MKKTAITPQERQWHVEQWRKSGLSQQAYCARHGLAHSSFKNWMRPTKADAVRTLVPVEVESPRDTDWIIEAAGGLRIAVPAHTDTASLLRLFAALRSPHAA